MEYAMLIMLMDDDLDILHFIMNIIIEELDHELADLRIRRRNERVRNKNYFEITIPRYTDIHFIEHFRMSRRTFQELLNVVAPFINEENVNVSMEKKLMFTIWILAKPESFLAAGDRFDLGKSTGHKIFKNVINALVMLMPEYIKWPNAIQCQLSSNIFQNRSRGFPGVIGAIDGCHIPCKQPIGNATDYYNRKGFHSIILQGVCDHKGLFIDIFIGMPGRMHDARVFRNSPLFQYMTNAEAPLNRPLIGDTAYPLLCNLMTPFKDNGHLTRSQISYNTKLSSIRSIIETAFGLLKVKFRRLKYLDISDFELGNNMIAAACVLHNFIINGDRLFIEEENYMIDADMEGLVDDNMIDEENFEAAEKRRQIVQQL
ncbi:uncharacterized protein [Linepithema humile]|uniref:uncharacterized protein n=1 Tax=Linepithema humile TaxID=83485 RepID=UPI00351E509E